MWIDGGMAYAIDSKSIESNDSLWVQVPLNLPIKIYNIFYYIVDFNKF